MEDVIETMNSVEIVVKEEEELFFIFFNPIFPMHSAKIHTFALSFQKQQNVINMKQKDVITGWLVAFIISCMMLAGCTEKTGS